MRIGFVGAGKVGFSLGKYMTERKVSVSGYYSLHPDSALLASEFTHTRHFLLLDDLVRASDAVFLTVPDGVINSVWNSLKRSDLQGKFICHCSGSLSSAIFSGIDRTGAFGYSIHPLFAVNDRLQSYKELSHAFFTIEGSAEHIQLWEKMFTGFGNSVRIISARDKTLYHASAVCVSNLVIGLYETAVRLLSSCGFSPDEAQKALGPLFIHNAQALAGLGCESALTGPVERADLSTIENHLDILSGNEREIYIRLSEVLVDIAKRKHPNKDYGAISWLLKDAREKERNGKNEKNGSNI